VSAYHDKPVSVVTKCNNKVETSKKGVTLFQRQVDLIIMDTIFARCTSEVEITREDIRRGVEEEGVAIGQLFRLYNILPSFDLHNAGNVTAAENPADAFEAASPRFWREYVLAGDGVECRIHEDIRSDLFELEQPAEPETVVAKPEVPSSLGDIMAPNQTFAKLPSGFTGLQRVLLTANGNVERILSSFYNRPVSLLVVNDHRRASAVFDRQVRAPQRHTPSATDSRRLPSPPSPSTLTHTCAHTRTRSDAETAPKAVC
jgi:hypothetical protein